jgi:hypothetical protein
LSLSGFNSTAQDIILAKSVLQTTQHNYILIGVISIKREKHLINEFSAGERNKE